MKNIIKKSFLVTCVATLGFLGLQTSKVEAITKYQIEKADLLSELRQQTDLSNKEIKQDNTTETQVKEDTTFESEVQAEPTIPSPEPKVEVTVETPAPAAPSTEPAKEPAAPAVTISNEEKDLFARLVEAEAKGESYEGKVAVATVVLNRVESPEFPNTITGVINEVVGDAYAFSPVQNGEINKSASDESIRAVEEALSRTNRLNDCIYFYNPDIATDTWIRSREVVTTIGNHVFAK